MMNSPASVCGNCGRILNQALFALTIDGVRHVFCADDCMKAWQNRNIQTCFACKSPVDRNGMIQYGDGRVSCPKCFASAVLDDRQLAKCRRRVLEFFFLQYRYAPPCCLQPKLCDSFVFRNNFRVLSRDVYGVYGVVRHGKVQACEIAVLRGLPADRLEETLAHEFAHDMMNHRWGMPGDLMCEEGFACYIQTRFNIFCGREKLNPVISSVDTGPQTGDPYCDGLRHYLAIEEKGGYPAIVRYLNRQVKHPKKGV